MTNVSLMVLIGHAPMALFPPSRWEEPVFGPIRFTLGAQDKALTCTHPSRT